MYIPYTALSKIMGSSRQITSFYVSSADGNSMDTVEQEMTMYLYQRLGDTDSFSIVNSSAVMETMSSVTDTMKLMLGGIAAISLLVGGIGIMNIMTVSVSERTREIGIRKAIGARTTDILTQFLVESAVLSTMGGMVGVVFGLIVGKSVCSAMSIDFVLEIGMVLLSFLFSLFIGVLFGIMPARKAAKLHPIDALRSE